MDNGSSYFFMLTFFISAVFSQIHPHIEFLNGFSRLNSNSNVDYYFFCNGSGTSVQWQINNYIVSLMDTDVGKARLCSNIEVECIATLLSSMPLSSILILSTNTTFTTLSVHCIIDNRTSETIHSLGDLKSAMLNKTMGNVFLQYQFERIIINNSPTYFYICGVDDAVQAWQTAEVASPFLPRDVIGASINKISEGIAIEAAFLIAREPYTFVSIFLVTGILNINVTCASNSNRSVIYYTDIMPITGPTRSSTDAEVTSTNRIFTIGTTIGITGPEYRTTGITPSSMNSSKLRDGIIAASAVVGTLFLLLLFIGMVSLVIYCKRKISSEAKRPIADGDLAMRQNGSKSHGQRSGLSGLRSDENFVNTDIKTLEGDVLTSNDLRDPVSFKEHPKIEAKKSRELSGEEMWFGHAHMDTTN